MKFTKVALALALLPLTAFASEVYFQSPSGNIYCEGGDNSVGCFIGETNKGYDGCAYIVDAGSKKGRKVCGADGANIDDEPVRTLQYGKSINGKGWTCTSQTTGMRCVNKSGKGFQLSKAKQTLF